MHVIQEVWLTTRTEDKPPGLALRSHDLRPELVEGINLNCAHCGSSDIRRVELIYNEGTSVESLTAEAKPKWNTKPFSPSGKQTIKGTRVVRTTLAEQCRPPSNSDSGFLDLFVNGLVSVLGFLSSCYLAAKVGIFFHSFWVGVLMFIVGLVGTLVAYSWISMHFLGGKEKHAKYQRDLAIWRRSWLCQRCGGVSVAN